MQPERLHPLQWTRHASRLGDPDCFVQWRPGSIRNRSEHNTHYPSTGTWIRDISCVFTLYYYFVIVQRWKIRQNAKVSPRRQELPH